MKSDRRQALIHYVRSFKNQPANQACCECGSLNPLLVLLVNSPLHDAEDHVRLGAFVCYNCSLALETLGKQVCTIKSPLVDTCKFESEGPSFCAMLEGLEYCAGNFNERLGTVIASSTCQENLIQPFFTCSPSIREEIRYYCYEAQRQSCNESDL